MRRRKRDSNKENALKQEVQAVEAGKCDFGVAPASVRTSTPLLTKRQTPSLASYIYLASNNALKH